MRKVYGLLVAMAVLLCLPGNAHAQRADENAVRDADDAFGTQVGQESTGIYNERNTRGFNPTEAGNVRIDGIYFDPVSILAGRMRQSTAIRVGFAAIDFPFVAPTGVVDHKFRPMPTEFGNSITMSSFPYGGYIAEWDFRAPIVADHIGLTGGIANARLPQVDGSISSSWGVTLRPIFRYGGMEFAPYVSTGKFGRSDAKPLVVVRDGYLPDLPPERKYLGQTWARGSNTHANHGATLKARISGKLSFRGGIFKSIGDRQSHFSEIYSVVDANGLSNHRVFADPAHDIRSTSGEALVALQLGSERINHRFFGGFRMRNRVTQTGGSQLIDITAQNGPVIFGEFDRIDEPEFAFTEPNTGRVRQSSWMLGYLGKLDGFGHLNLGIQKARYRAKSLEGATGLIDRSQADPWLYNATLMIDLSSQLSIYAATQRGLEDSGTAPENATNRNEQLPATQTTQYEGGVRWDFGKGHLIVSAFEIAKPYFSFDVARNFVAQGQRRHRGIEASLSGHFGDRLDLLAGAVMIDADVTGPARVDGDVGRRPAGTPDIYGQLDVNYRTDLLNGLTLTGALIYTGKRAVTTRAFGRLKDDQLTLPGWMRVDLGMRHRFKLGCMDVSIRAVMQNVFDEKQWKVLSSDVLTPEDRRRMLAIFIVDF